MGDDPEDLPQFYRLLSKEESKKKHDAWNTIMSVILLFVVSQAILWVFRRFTKDVHRRIENHLAEGWKTKIGGLALRALVRLMTMCFFAATTLALFFIFMDRTGPQSVLVATYLTAFLVVMGVRLVTRFFLSPGVPQLRFLPMSTETARYLYHWILAIATVTSFGWLTCGIFRVAGTGEGNHLMMIAAVNLITVGMIITMILQKRNQVRQALSINLPDTGLLEWLAKSWHYLAISGAIILWLFSTLNLLLFGFRPGGPGTKTLLIIPIYFLLDWALREILRVVFGIAEKSAETLQAPKLEALNDGAADFKPTSEETVLSTDAEIIDEDEIDEPIPTEKKDSIISKHMSAQRLNRIVGTGLRLALAAFVFFFLLDVWGIQIPFGKAIARTAFNILIAVLICYAAWEVISAAIQRRIQQEMPEQDGEGEEGGAGGSRIGTLLLLLRKFMLAVIVTLATMIILSSLGVNIGPLIAGAGVIGLAIGFGAQTLVKDIISGLFFLMDDAFRVGDYINTAGTKGMVQHISLRSIQLRHPRGMVHTIPFGDMGTVTNFSRDYIITKLDIRVRYDANIKKIKKIVKKINKEIRADEELSQGLLEDIKSQGVRQMDDSAMILRVKFKTIPGEQFVLRREVYRMIQDKFKENGIEFAHRNVTVYLPSETEQATANSEPEKEAEKSAQLERELIEKAGAAAAITTIQAEEDDKKR